MSKVCILYPLQSVVRKDDTAPAAKADLGGVGREIDELRREVREEGEETRRHFDVVAEQLFHDFKGAFSDRTAQHDDQIRDLSGRMDVVEHKIGLVA